MRPRMCQARPAACFLTQHCWRGHSWIQVSPLVALRTGSRAVTEPSNPEAEQRRFPHPGQERPQRLRPWGACRPPRSHQVPRPTTAEHRWTRVQHVYVLEKELSKIPSIHQKQTGRCRESEQGLRVSSLTACPSKIWARGHRCRDVGLSRQAEAERPRTHGFPSARSQDGPSTARSRDSSGGSRAQLPSWGPAGRPGLPA